MKKNQINMDQMIGISTLKRFNKLEKSNNILKTRYTKATTEKRLLKNELKNKFVSSFARKALVEQAIKKYGISIRQACQLFNLSRTAFYYEGCRSDPDEAEKRLLELAEQHPQFGYWKYYSILRSEGYVINHKRVYRIYKQSIRQDRCQHSHLS